MLILKGVTVMVLAERTRIKRDSFFQSSSSGDLERKSFERRAKSLGSVDRIS